MSTDLEVSRETAGSQPILVEQKICSNCHSQDPALEYLEHDGKCLCLDCYDELVAQCKHCGEPFWRDDMTQVNTELYCDECLDEHFRHCSACEEYVDRDRAYYSEIHDCDYCENCFSNYVTNCVSCDGQIDPETCHVSNEGESYCDECWERRDEERREGEYFEHAGSLFVRCLSRRKYGIEIEALIKEDENHVPSDQLGHWQQVTDGSIGEKGREYVSPILQGDEGFQEIDRMTTLLKSHGYFVKRQCGLHVHIDGRDLECGDIKKLLKITRYYEPVLYAMLPASRREGTYSVPLQRFPKSRFRIGIKDEEALKRLWYGRKGETVNLKSKYHHSRYYGLNIHSWFFRRSLEFRYHSGTLNPLKITNFIIICQAMVDKAKGEKKFKIPEPCDFQTQLARFVSFLELAPELATYIRERIEKFHPEQLATPALAQA